MRIAVNLDDEFRVAGGEVGDVGTDDELAGELGVAYLSTTQVTPELSLRRSWLPPHPLGAIQE